MTLPLDQLATRVDSRLERMSTCFEQYWDRKGGPSRSQRWHMRHPVLAPASAFVLALAVMTGITILDPGSGPHWLPVLVLVLLGAVFLPLQYRIQHHVRRRYDAWRQKQPTPAFAGDGHSDKGERD